ncbi:flagellar hook-associated protein FlgL [Catenovulum sp. SM1970]|uniref:flagellar hook-associated protein FlgL n=1 Tax=Marinifaba aquimaris TaxID=2741323 RepID=UPI001572C332|nr:flagellar hook-associated protein FlgL [Marinifaba aquimaris]NTS75394.1 flagellar hook-associated protein FlgL [Marinifaba aquimaris]
MRVTTNMIYQNSINGILENQKQLLRSQDVIIEGTHILKPSDDPTGATKVVRYEEDLARYEQYEKNIVLLNNTLQDKESALKNSNDALLKARTLMMQAGDGAYDFSDRKSIAAELSLIRDELQDLMNSTDASGDYLFAGSKTNTPPFQRDSNGVYQYEGDQMVNQIQISDTLKLETDAPGSGFAIFENIDGPSTLTINGTSTATGSYRVIEQDAFEDFHDQNYVAIPPSPAGSNDFSIVLAAGSYQLQDNLGNVIDSGSFDASGTDIVRYKGLEFDVTGTPGQQVDFTLDPPVKKNPLNVLDELVQTLNTTETFTEGLQQKLQGSIYSLDKAQVSIGNGRSEIGGRQNIVKSVELSNVDQTINLKEAKAKVSETDLAEAISNLQQHETALQAAQQIYPKVTGLSLLSFIR